MPSEIKLTCAICGKAWEPPVLGCPDCDRPLAASGELPRIVLTWKEIMQKQSRALKKEAFETFYYMSETEHTALLSSARAAARSETLREAADFCESAFTLDNEAIALVLRARSRQSAKGEA